MGGGGQLAILRVEDPAQRHVRDASRVSRIVLLLPLLYKLSLPAPSAMTVASNRRRAIVRRNSVRIGIGH